MAHPAQVNPFSGVVHVRHGAFVHDNFLRNTSEKMDKELDRYHLLEEDSQEEPCLLLDPCELSGRLAVKMWTGFLYGQPMWIPRRNKTISDFEGLISVYSFARTYVHYFAEDATLDAIRLMVRTHSDVLNLQYLLPRLTRFYAEREKFHNLSHMLTELIVYGNSAGEAERWTDLNLRRDDNDVIRLKNRSAYMFQCKAGYEAAGYPPTDVMLVCSYHSHLFQGRPCYLGDKGFGCT